MLSGKTLDAVLVEVLCYAFDEYFDGICRTIHIYIHNDSFTVHYNAGISLENSFDNRSKAERIMTEFFVCKNEKKYVALGEEFCSLGMETINYAAEGYEMTTLCNGKKGVYIFKKRNNRFKGSRHG